jgi:hypothetical protein
MRGRLKSPRPQIRILQGHLSHERHGSGAQGYDRLINLLPARQTLHQLWGFILPEKFDLISSGNLTYL